MQWLRMCAVQRRAQRRRFARWPRRLVAALMALVCVTASVVAGGVATPVGFAASARQAEPTQAVALEMVATPTEAGIGAQVSLQIRVRTSQSVSGAAAYVNFDPARLQAIAIAPGGVLNISLASRIDNGAGQVDYVAGRLSGFPTTDFTLATIVFAVVSGGGATQFTFVEQPPRRSDVTGGGVSLRPQLLGTVVTLIPNPMPTDTATSSPPTWTPTSIPVLPATATGNPTSVTGTVEPTQPATATVGPTSGMETVEPTRTETATAIPPPSTGTFEPTRTATPSVTSTDVVPTPAPGSATSMPPPVGTMNPPVATLPAQEATPSPSPANTEVNQPPLVTPPGSSTLAPTAPPSDVTPVATATPVASATPVIPPQPPSSATPTQSPILSTPEGTSSPTSTPVPTAHATDPPVPPPIPVPEPGTITLFALGLTAAGLWAQRARRGR